MTKKGFSQKDGTAGESPVLPHVLPPCCPALEDWCYGCGHDRSTHGW